jgi:hypothetical protein
VNKRSGEGGNCELNPASVGVVMAPEMEVADLAVISPNDAGHRIKNDLVLIIEVAFVFRCGNGRAQLAPIGNGIQPTCRPPQLGMVSVAPLRPHLAQRADRRSMAIATQ